MILCIGTTSSYITLLFEPAVKDNSIYILYIIYTRRSLQMRDKGMRFHLMMCVIMDRFIFFFFVILLTNSPSVYQLIAVSFCFHRNTRDAFRRQRRDFYVGTYPIYITLYTNTIHCDVVGELYNIYLS